jgi:hypothetical protein
VNVPAQIVASEKAVFAQAAGELAILNAGSTFHLFGNDLTPDPSTTLPSAFREATFDGYSATDLTGRWDRVKWVQLGQYELTPGPVYFQRPAAVGGWVYGWWIDDGDWVRYSYRYPAPFNFLPSSAAWSAWVSIRFWAGSTGGPIILQGVG